MLFQHDGQLPKNYREKNQLKDIIRTGKGLIMQIIITYPGGLSIHTITNMKGIVTLVEFVECLTHIPLVTVK